MTIRAHVLISGRVQGVFFRQSTRDLANSLCLSGWVRNINDGRVEAMFEGDEEDVRRAVLWCHKGPNGADVESVESDYGQKPEGGEGFQILF
jgi:acylphosphatase